MNKEELTRELEYTEKKHRQDTVNTFDTDISMMCADVLRVLKNCIEIPNNATNGDMIKDMFPNAKIIINECLGVHGTVYFEYDKIITFYPLDWWNSPYRKEQK